MGDNADDMQAAFQQFMLSGGGAKQGSTSGSSSNGKKKKKGKKNEPQTPPQVTKDSPLKSPNAAAAKNKRLVQRQKIKKQFWQIMNAFQKTLKEDWLAVDDHCGHVVASIVNLRERIRMTSKQLWDFKEYGPKFPISASQGSGYRTYPKDADAVLGFLTRDDLELALSHGLMQHEKMLAGVRKLISSLNQTEEALGRRLEELMTLQMEMSPLLLSSVDTVLSFEDDDNEQEQNYELQLFAGRIVHWSREVYTALAQELYRKQLLVQTILDSVNDGLLHHRDNDDLENDSTPLKVAEKCHKEWVQGGSSKDDREYLAALLNATPWEPKDDGDSDDDYQIKN